MHDTYTHTLHLHSHTTPTLYYTKYDNINTYTYTYVYAYAYAYGHWKISRGAWNAWTGSIRWYVLACSKINGLEIENTAVVPPIPPQE